MNIYMYVYGACQGDALLVLEAGTIYVYICIYTHTYVYNNTHIYTLICIYLYVYVYTSIYIYIYIHRERDTYIIYKQMYVCKNVPAAHEPPP